MAPSPPRLRILSVGGNAVSAFLSWRLQATNSCDVTLVWKSGFESVAQYGVSFRSKIFGNERFKPRHVVRSPEEASARENAYDYVVLCVKALPDVYDLGSVIESVVTPQHTCILVNTTNTLGIESHLEQRFPTNVVLSLVSNVNIMQTGTSEFEHEGASEIWVGPASRNPSIPAAIQNDMASALAITLSSGQVDCKVSPNIRQEQFERMIGPIAFHPASVLFENPSHAQLLEKVGLRQLVSDVIDELVQLATTQGCSFSSDFREKTIDKMMAPSDVQSTMYQDFVARRPLEVETYLGSPVRLAMESAVRMPRTETLYAMLHHVNIVNQSKPPAEFPLPILAQPSPRTSSVPPLQQRPIGNGMRSSRTASGMGMPMPPPQRRGPPPMGGPIRPPSAQPVPNRMPRDASFDDNGLEEFSHLVVYDDFVDGAQNGNGVHPPDMSNGAPGGPPDFALRERELALRQREMQLREREMMNMRRGPRRAPPPQPSFDEEDEDDFFDPMDFRPPPGVDPDNIDMMSVTSRRARKAPSVGQLRKNPEMGGPPPNMRPPSSFSRYLGGGRKSTSSRLIQEIPTLHGSVLDDAMMGYSSNRYGMVDRKEMHMDSRANSLTAASRMGDYGPGPYPPSRRTSGSPGMPFPPGGRGMSRPGTAQDHHSYGPPNGAPNGMPPFGRPSPPGNMRAPVPRYPPGHGNAMAAQQVEQHLGVSNSYPVKSSPNVRSLTGSASASAESGDSGASANIDSENSAHSSQISLAHTTPMPVR